MRRTSLLRLVLGFCLACHGAVVAAQEPPVIALVGATIHPVSAPAIDRGTVLVVEDTLVAVGPSDAVEVPDGAVVHDLNGKHLYPAFVHPWSALGLTEILGVRTTDDTRELGDDNAGLRAEVAFHADSRLLPVAVAGGVVYAHVVPQGGLLAGRTAVMRLDGWNWRQMTVKSAAGLHLAYPPLRPRRGFGPASRQSPEEVKKKAEESIATLGRRFAAARAYHSAGGGAPVDPKLEVLAAVLSGDLPLFLRAEESSQIESALDWVEEMGIPDPILVTGPDAARHAQRLAQDGVRVILLGTLRTPGEAWQPHDDAYTAPTRLHAAEVRFALADRGGRFTAPNARNLPFHAAMAVAHGLPREVALEAVTLRPAEILGVADRLGSLEAGKEASFLILGGGAAAGPLIDPLEPAARIDAVWVAGRPVDPEDNPQWRLYRHYRRRPQP